MKDGTIIEVPPVGLASSHDGNIGSWQIEFEPEVVFDPEQITTFSFRDLTFKLE
jgi:hypothetical protein